MAKGFRFRLERLLDLRRAKEGVAQRALADARRAVEEEERRLAELLAEEEEGRRTSRGLRQGLLDLDVLRHQESHRSTIERRIGTSRERLLALGKTEQAARGADGSDEGRQGPRTGAREAPGGMDAGGRARGAEVPR